MECVNNGSCIAFAMQLQAPIFDGDNITAVNKDYVNFPVSIKTVNNFSLRNMLAQMYVCISDAAKI